MQLFRLIVLHSIIFFEEYQESLDSYRLLFKNIFT